MKEITLTRGKSAIVDNNDYILLRQHKWYCSLKGYAVRNIIKDKKQTLVLMHRFILDTPEGMETDHINGNKLDNRKENLRICTTSQNQGNRKINKNSSLQLKGVYFHKKDKKFRATIHQKNNSIHLGSFETKEEAALAYNKAAKKYFGEFACLNGI